MAPTFRAGTILDPPLRPVIQLEARSTKTWSSTHRKPGRASFSTTSRQAPKHRAEDT